MGEDVHDRNRVTKEGCVWTVVGGCAAFYAFWWGLVKVAALAWR